MTLSEKSTKAKMKWNLLVLLAFWRLSSAIAKKTKCSFLSLEEGPAFSFDLPPSVLSHPLSDLPIEFLGISPIVTRARVKPGQIPKLTVVRYSARPEVTYDEVSNRVVVSSSKCDDGMNEDSLPIDISKNGGLKPKEEAPSLGSSSSASTSLMTTAGPQFLVFVSTALVFQSSPLLAGIWALGSSLTFTHAQTEKEEVDCQEVVQILVEAPAAYKGAVDLCRQEINDSAVCPDDFPTYPACNEVAPTCEVAVVGGGAGGLYTALRMVDEGVVAASDVCVFEMTERVGGRLLSLRGLGPDDDLVVDAGGYRTWPEFTPTLHALITEYLGLPMGCYDDSVPCQVYNIVDENGTKAGFALFVEEMMQRLSDGGACFFPYHELSSFSKVSSVGQIGNGISPTELYFANGVTATANMAMILNLPQRPLLNVVRESKLDEKGLLAETTLGALHSVQTVIATKLYLYYPRGSVFWYKLGLRSGDFSMDGDARNMLLAGRYHDGHVECDDENDLDTCHGFLLAVYANDLSGNKAQYFRRYQRDRPEPVTILTNQDLEGRQFLRHAHQRIMNYHLYDMPQQQSDAPSSYTGFEAQQIFNQIDSPEFAVLSTWSTSIPWAGGAWHAWTDTDTIDLATRLPSFANHGIYVVNEAYSLLQGWAEGTIKVADTILEDHFAISRPWNFTVVDLNQIVQQTNSRECSAEESTFEEESGMVEVSRGGGGQDEAAVAALLCFTGDARIQMSDGNWKQIRDVRVNDEIISTMDGRMGIVTETLSHPVHRTVEVAVLPTEHGDLIGTPDHPVLQDGIWIEFADLSSSTSTTTSRVKTERRYVDTFYNLEVDGHLLQVEDDEQDPNASSLHSYVVNGIVASGLGDGELNLRFPRQKQWKDVVAFKTAGSGAGDGAVSLQKDG